MSPWLTEALCLATVFVAACVRGYAGFGFSAIAIGVLSLWRSPSELVPIILLLEIPASLLLLRQSLVHFSRRWMLPLVGGSVLGIPVGVGLLASLPLPWLQLVVSLSILGSSLAARWGWRPRHGDTQAYRWITGLVGGLLNGLSVLGGIVCAVMLASVRISPHTLRATLTLLFLFTDVYALLLAWLAGLVQAHMLVTASLWGVPLALGIYAGSQAFHSSDTSLFRHRMFGLLMLLGTMGVVKAAWTLAA